MDVFSALADPRRREIIEMIAHGGELSAGDICDNFDITAPAVSQHLKILRESNIIGMEKRAQQRIYHINKNAIHELDTWIKHMTNLWNKRLDRLEHILTQEKKKGGKHGKK